MSNEEKMSLTDYERASLRTELFKTWVTFALACIAGEITLLHTVYKNSIDTFFLYISVGCFALSIIFWLGAYEAIVNESTGIPKFKNRMYTKFFYLEPKTHKAGWLLSRVSEITFAIGIMAFVIFVMAD